MKVLIDADMFAFIACSTVEKEIDWGNDVWTLHADLGEAKAHFIDSLNYAIESAFQKMQYTGDFEVIFCLSDANNFRKKILPTYKANRIGKRKPVCYRGMIEWIKQEYNTCLKPSLEADDCIGILATENIGDSVIISGDKDMKCLPGYHYDFLSDEYANISEEDADKWFFMQTLMGDTTDGYSGCPGVGKITAAKILEDDCSWQSVVSTYEKKKLTEADALLQARVARILRTTDYNAKKKKVILWTPQGDN